MSRVEAIVLETTGDAKANLGRGVSVTVDVVVGTYENVMLVPEEAVITSYEKPFVYIVSEGRLARRDVRLLASDGSTAAVKGVEAGDIVVVHSPWGWAALSEGLEVTTE